jgi:SnoaL-like domain
VRRDFDAMMSFFAPDAIWDLSSAGIGRFEGAAAIRTFHEDWIGSYGEYENQPDVQDLGNDVLFVVLSLDARPAGSAGMVRERWGFTVTWAKGMIVRVIGSTDIDDVLPPNASPRNGGGRCRRRTWRSRSAVVLPEATRGPNRTG